MGTVFEKYSGKSRRIAFFARYEASQLGGEAIEPEHILLAILREDPGLLESILPQGEASSSLMRTAIGTTMRGKSKPDASIDLPLSPRAKTVLDIAAREQEASGDERITPKHVLLGLVLDEGSLAARLLRENGVTADSIRRMPVDTAGSLPRRKQSEAAQILDQLSVLIDVLIRRGVFSRQDLAEELASRYILPDIHATLNSLLAVLVRKGAINDFDRREIAGISEL
jgi:ATP-dependent Clp protease ATP-binding subunit ClpC